MAYRWCGMGEDVGGGVQAGEGGVKNLKID